MREKIDFTPDFGTKENSSIIKVIGVGGGGGNAVKHMYSEGIVGVDFLICNTDRQALENNVIPSKLVLGETGLGAGAKPEVARKLAEESIEKLKTFIGEETQMLFITAGMGKGTGTGAAPIVAKVAHEMGILTIGVATFPFRFEGKPCEQRAKEGIAELEKYVDSLIVVKNQNIMKYYNDEDVDVAYSHADDVLKNAVKCIAELITVNAQQNIDFNDIKTIMKDSGHAMLGLAEANGEDRVERVVEEALSCPLISEDVITKAQNFLFFISYGPDKKLKMSELEALTENFEKYQTSDSDVIFGRALDPNLGDKIRLSVIVTNYEHEHQKVASEVTIPSIETQKPWADVFGETTPLDFNLNTQVNDIPTQPQTKEEDSIWAQTQQMQMEMQRRMSETFANVQIQPQMQPQPEAPVTQVQVAAVPVSSDVFMAEPQRIGSNQTLYEDDDFFNDLVNTPAILREKRQNDLDAHNIFNMDNDMSDFFKNIPD